MMMPIIPRVKKGLLLTININGCIFFIFRSTTQAEAEEENRHAALRRRRLIKIYFYVLLLLTVCKIRYVLNKDT